MKKSWDSWYAFLLVIGLHAGAIGIAVWSPSPKTQELSLPTVQGIIIPAPPAETVQMPATKDVPPVKPAPEKPKPKPKKAPVKPKSKPVIPPPPSERAIALDEAPAEESAPAPQPVATPDAKESETVAAPITPPREDASQLNNPRPAYPNISRRLREQGTVVLEVLILPDGTVGEVRIKESSGFKRLDNVAVQAVKHWTYVPAKRGDEAIAFWYLQPLEFSLH